MPTYTFTIDQPYDEVEGALDTAQGALQDQCYPDGDRQAGYIRQIMATLTGGGVTPTDWAQTASDLASGDPARIGPHLPCRDCPHPRPLHSENGCLFRYPGFVCACTASFTPESSPH